MKLPIASFYLLLSIPIILSCSPSKNKHENEHAHEHGQFNIDDLHLNDGMKWQVNEATHVGYKHINDTLQNFIGSQNDITPYHQLGGYLIKETNVIVKKCDMTGEAHDQLHMVLLPLIEKVKALNESDKIEDAQQHLEEIKQLVTLYDDHFKY